MKRRTILVDATPTLDTSGQRGIGRFIYELLRALQRTRDEWRDELTIRAVTDLDRLGGGVITDDLGAAADTLEAARGSQIDRIDPKRRVSLPFVARGHDLLHLCEARGTPFFGHPRTCVTCFDLIPLRMPEHYLGGWWTTTKRRWKDARRYGSRVRRIVAISRRTKLDLVELLHVPEAKIDVVPIGIDETRWSATPSPNDASILQKLGVGARPYVVYVGYCDPRKAVDTMMRAMARVRSRVDLDFVWAGGMTEADVARMRAMAEREGIADRMRLLGYVDDEALAALYRGAVAHLFLSRLEGYGLSVAEAQACGCPAIVTADSGADEIGGEGSVIVARDDDVAAADAMARLATDADLRARHVALGMQRMPLFDRPTMARAYLDVWRRVLQEA